MEKGLRDFMKDVLRCDFEFYFFVIMKQDQVVMCIIVPKPPVFPKYHLEFVAYPERRENEIKERQEERRCVM